MYGRADNSLQLLQRLNKKTRQFCRKEKDLRTILSNPPHDEHLSNKALDYEALVHEERLDGELEIGKKWMSIASYKGWYKGEMQDGEARGEGTWHSYNGKVS